MKSIMNVKIPRNTVLDILDDIDQVLEAWRLAYIERRPLEAAEWRTGMNLMIAIKVSCSAALREEESND